MRILVAPDKFKGSLGASEVAECVAAGLLDVLPDAEVVCRPVADGGEGTAKVICEAGGGAWHACAVHDPLGELVQARYCTIENGRTAVMEMSEAAGLWRVPPAMRDVVVANSFGVGEMLLEAARRGVDKIIVGLGGSATNDGGFGMARALGFRFLDAAGHELVGPISDLLRLARIQPPAALQLPDIIAAADVRNRLLGARGATHVFGAQKGANAQQLEILEQALTRLSDVAARDFGRDLREAPGAGAAGGLGFGLMTFLGAWMHPGFEVVAEFVGLEKAVRAADVVITGEGRLDAQTLEGKAPAGVARLAGMFAKPVYAIAGATDETPALRELFARILILVTPQITADAAIHHAAPLLRERARELAATLRG